MLRRGKPQPAPKSVNPRPTAASADSKKPEAAKQAPAEASAEARYQLLAAISDADGPEPRPFTYEANPTQRSNYEKELGALARNAVGKYEGERQAGSARVELGISKFRVFDVDFSNQAVFVFVAPATVTFGPRAQRTSRVQQPAPSIPEGVQAYVTVVARLDIYGEVRQLFSSVTDARHLDQIPRLEFIDAVDADGDGRGELLFREVTDSGQGFAIYRVLPDTLSKIFGSMGPAD